MYNIAIQGHLTRGKDVIKILKELGGYNIFNFLGIRTDCYYFINNKKCIEYLSKEHIQDFHLPFTQYTLEEYE